MLPASSAFASAGTAADAVLNRDDRDLFAEFAPAPAPALTSSMCAVNFASDFAWRVEIAVGSFARPWGYSTCVRRGVGSVTG